MRSCAHCHPPQKFFLITLVYFCHFAQHLGMMIKEPAFVNPAHEMLETIKLQGEYIMALEAPSVVDDLTNHVNHTLAESKFFAGLKQGTHSIEHVRAVFSQYYLWRNRFHRWFGVCIAKASALGTNAP